jgi:hypothetical protein
MQRCCPAIRYSDVYGLCRERRDGAKIYTRGRQAHARSGGRKVNARNEAVLR